MDKNYLLKAENKVNCSTFKELYKHHNNLMSHIYYLKSNVLYSAAVISHASHPVPQSKETANLFSFIVPVLNISCNVSIQ